ncbi:hypothetical protein EVAR_44553_1 [Eumeta japonica]|uniref:Histone-lysine N-methyltransferase SETMAR n=1 Tax=Eumeta variegata TaxID=151549 RepID=A0A4C1XC31_EUMVA|nr:hypothetical protein EVAR_44553_1 [Eumeta japonica]
MTWKKPSAPPPKKFKPSRSAGKTMGSLFWIEYFDRGATVTGALSAVAIAAIRDAGFEVLEHQPYSPDFVPSDLYLFPRLKKYLKGQRFDDEAVIVVVQDFLCFQDEEFLKKNVLRLIGYCHTSAVTNENIPENAHGAGRVILSYFIVKIKPGPIDFGNNLSLPLFRPPLVMVIEDSRRAARHGQTLPSQNTGQHRAAPEASAFNGQTRTRTRTHGHFNKLLMARAAFSEIPATLAGVHGDRRGARSRHGQVINISEIVKTSSSQTTASLVIHRWAFRSDSDSWRSPPRSSAPVTWSLVTHNGYP